MHSAMETVLFFLFVMFIGAILTIAIDLWPAFFGAIGETKKRLAAKKSVPPRSR